EIKGGAFKGCKNLKGIYLMGETTSIGTHAFEGCEILENVSVPDTVTEMGLAPFLHCDELSHVDFQGSKYFTCEDSIIYELDADGNKYKVIEFLNGRATGVVAPSEMEGVKAVAPEAFMSTHVSSVDFRTSEVGEIPESAFEDTPKLFAVYLPDTCKAIEKDAFKDSGIAYMEVPGSVSYIDNDAFSGDTNKSGLQFYCEEGSNADIYAKKQGILTTSKPIELSYTVTFWDWDATLLDTQEVEAGQDAIPPEVPGRKGYVHTGWVPDYHGVTADLQITAQYEAEDPDASKFTVTFLDYNDTVLKTVLVAPGQDAEPPFDPVREGYTFMGWRPAVTNIQEDTTIYAQYEKKDSSELEFTVRFIDYDDTVLYTQKVASGESAITPQNPTREGYVFTGWRPAITEITKDLDTYAQYEKICNGTGNDGTGSGSDGTGDGSGDGSGNGSGSDDGDDGDDGDDKGDDKTTTKLYTLTVQNGSGSGSYAAGSQPIVIANDPASGMEFSHWTIAPTSTKIASTVLTATVITMPEDNVTVTAHYKKRTGNYVTTGSGNSGSTSSNRPGTNSGSISNGGTTVVIDKNGLSNTGVVSATVNGSSDDFTIKVTESSSAAEAVVRALQAEYGDLDGIKYFPMDISLYDSTGKKKITDTTGLSVSITLPLPDSLITYAGNNKVASVVDNRLDKLTPKFTTISGVPCVTFTAEHFSPYVIYVDTNNLTAGTITDSTPKTGDGVHPKWFLSIGLACLSFVMFMKRDKRELQKVKVRA
ncbi:MAG: leucine-rich repeat protein, partial [Lachnospiraceae bacterium]|nr:leucine-rich repeat protein [Lachnospiraceae bacterium]